MPAPSPAVRVTRITCAERFDVVFVCWMQQIGRDSFPGGAARLQIWQGPSVGSWWVRLPLFSANDRGRCLDAAVWVAMASRIPGMRRYNARMNEPTLKIIADLADIPAADWDALAGNDPFVSHAYLYALQQSGCATKQFGWHAQFLTLWQDRRLVGAMPLYLKMNSYGEHVFDFAWADAYRRSGLRYYPKLVCTVPFTPVTGKRLLAAPGADGDEVRALLLSSALRFARDGIVQLGSEVSTPSLAIPLQGVAGVSSLHCLFLDEDDAREAEAEAQGMMLRQDVQFHWQNIDPVQNRGYRDFDEYLAALSRDKRKRIKQERRKVQEAGIALQCITGEHATPEQWAFFASCYAHTRQMHHSPPTLNADFFQRIGATLPRNTLLVIASRDGRMIASALNLFTGDVLYGRSWGAFDNQARL